jgi:hypothetical protein
VGCATLALLVGLLYQLVARPAPHGAGRLSPLLMPIACLVLAAPYVIWLHAQTGMWRLEGKALLNYTAAKEIQEGVPTYQALFGIDDNLTETGLFIQSNLSALQSSRLAPAEFWRYLRGRKSEVVPFLRQAVTSEALFGSPPLFVFVTLGLFRKPWDRELAADQFFLALSLLLAGSALFFIFYLAPRFMVEFVPILIVWGAGGVWSIAEWFESTLGLLGDGVPRSWVGLAAVPVLATVIPLVALRAVGYYWDLNAFGSNSRPIRVAADWLNEYASGSKSIIDTSATVAFYTAARFAPYPYTSSEGALRFLDKRRIRFVVLKDENLWSRPYLNDWMTNGIPSARATLIYDVGTPHMGRIKIYEWHGLDSDERKY